MYVFLADSELNIPTDSPGHLLVGAATYEAVVVAVQGLEVTVAVNDSLGERVPAAVLVTAPYFLLEILARRLDEARQGRLRSINRHLALALLNKEPGQPLPARPAGVWAAEEQGPNPEQLQAIAKALSQEVTFIWGPPGTGKTKTLAWLVQELIASGERVLITSHTNAAVDVAFEPIVKRLAPDARERGVAVRVGTPQRLSELVQQCTLDAIVERRSAGLQAERQQVERRKQELEQRLQRIEMVLGVLEAVRQAEAMLQEAREAHAQAHRTLEEARLEAAAADAEVRSLRLRLQEAETMSWLRQLLTGTHPARLRQRLAAAERALQASSERLAIAKREAEAAAVSLRQAETAYEAALARQERLSVTADETELRRLQRDTSDALEAARRRLAEIDAAIAALTRAVLQEARVVAATLAKLSIMDELLSEPFDTVVVDEASIIPVPYVWLAALVAKRRVVVAGDFRQLPPIAVANDETRYPLAAQWLAQDIFDLAGILDDQKRLNREAGPRLAKLVRQYRMHPDIGDLVNTLVYDRDGNRLKHEVDVGSGDIRRGLEAPPEAGHPVVLCDTSDANPWCARDASRSRYNLYSAVVAVRLAARAAASHPDLTVGLVTPYRTQVRLLQVLAEHYGLAPERVRIATVHRFQGDQQDLIILDLVDGPPHPIGRLLKGIHPSTATRLLNVACSRARGKLVVVAHTAYFGHLLAEHSLKELLRYFGEHGRWVDARSVLARHDDPDVLALAGFVDRNGIALPQGSEPVFYNETTFFSAFQQDLAAARQQVVIFSPYIHVNRLSQIAPHLRAALERGVQVAVVTRPEREQPEDGTSLHQELMKVGVRVIPRTRMHEKVAIIDERVAWFGSLNILSHSGSTEWMMRFSDPPVVQRMAEVTGAAGVIERSDKQDALRARRQQLQAVLEARVALPRCPNCGQPTRLVFGRYGPFFGCTVPRCEGKVNLPRPVVQAAVNALELECPACGSGRLRARWGQHGAFLSCSRYPDCRHSEDL